MKNNIKKIVFLVILSATSVSQAVEITSKIKDAVSAIIDTEPSKVIGYTVMGVISPIFSQSDTIKGMGKDFYEIHGYNEANGVYETRDTTKKEKLMAVSVIAAHGVGIASYLAVVVGLPIYGAVKATKAIIAKVKKKKAQAAVDATEDVAASEATTAEVA